jgi:hypothetical protein
LKAYPNPAGHQVRFEFSLSEKNTAELAIYNLTGQKVKSILNEPLQAGHYSVINNVSDLPVGNYLIRIQSGEFVKTMPLTVVR